VGYKSLLPHDFLALRDEGCCVFDVRTPQEYEVGHIPGALSLPLLYNDERAKVGTLYVNVGREYAFVEALRMVGPRLPAMVEFIRERGKGMPVLFYCWRGGMRSDSVASLSRWSGLTSYTLAGGYKGYRRYLLEFLSRKMKIAVIGGYTGTGKSRLLMKLAERGEQVLNLEEIACHRGSVFGHLGMGSQPTTQHFQNMVFEKIRKFNLRDVIWVEDESIKVGEVFLPEPLYRNMREAPAFFVSRPFEERLEYVLQEYSKYPREELIKATLRLENHIDRGSLSSILEHIERGDLRRAAHILLRYYDERYMSGFKRRAPDRVMMVDAGGRDDDQIAEMLIKHKSWVEEIYKGVLFA